MTVKTGCKEKVKLETEKAWMQNLGGDWSGAWKGTKYLVLEGSEQKLHLCKCL